MDNASIGFATSEDIPPALDPEILSSLPDEIDSSNWDRVKIKTLRLCNFGRHENVFFDFTEKGKPINLACFVGPNGTGKTTVLNAVQLLFNNYTMYKIDRYTAMMTKYVRNWFKMTPSEMEESDFSIVGTFTNSEYDYEVELCRSGVKSWHPKQIATNLIRHCYAARFDKELHMFQMSRSRWKHFRKLFHSVTGFQIEEVKNLFDDSSDIRLKKLHDEYVTSFRIINKDKDVFTNRGMSAGERKITKCFSTIYNLPVQPNIIMIDNVTDHVELDRHLALLSAMEECFPDSQLFLTCHSMPVQRNFDRNRIYDLRFLGASKDVVTNPWKLRMIDEIKDISDKVVYSKNVPDKTKEWAISTRLRLTTRILLATEGTEVCNLAEDFIGQAYEYIMCDLMKHPPLKMRGR